jgi:uncharacterized repeat protein (TIGR01451 family)
MTTNVFKSQRWLGRSLGWVALVGLLQAPSAWATLSTFSITQSQSGGLTAPLNVVGDTVAGVGICPANPTPGCDFSLSDALVRTHDIVEYLYSVNNSGTDTNMVITANAPLGMVWDNLPAFCGVGSTVNNNPVPTGDGVSTPSVLTCRIVGAQTNQSLSLPFRARVLGVPNATNLTPTGRVVSTESAAGLTGTGPTNVVTAAPRFDLQKTEFLPGVFGNHTDVNGNVIRGYKVTSSLSVLVDGSTGTVIGGVPSTAGRVGAAPLDGTFTFTDLMSGLPAGSALISCVAPQPNTVLPVPTYSVGGAAKSVASSGTLACSQSAPGANASMTWSGVNTTMNHVPTLADSGSALPGGASYVAVATVTHVVPIASIPIGTVVAAKNCVNAFSPTGGTSGGAPISNYVSNQEPGFAGTGKNCATVNLSNVAQAGSQKLNVNSVADNGNFLFSGSLTPWDGSNLVTPDRVYASDFQYRNDGAVDFTNPKLCDVWDARKQQMQPIAGAGTFGGGYVKRIDGSITGVEFSSTYVTPGFPDAVSFPNSAAIKAECAATTGWVTDPNLLPGGASSATKVRISLGSMPAGAVFRGVLSFKALGTNPVTGVAWPSNTVIPNWAALRADELNPGWFDTGYAPGTYPGAPSGIYLGDRVVLQQALVRINKVTLDAAGTTADDSTNTALAGGSVGYALLPSLQAPAGLNVNMVVYDALPVGVTYLGGTSTVGGVATPPSITTCTGVNAPNPGCTVPGQQSLSWNLGVQVQGTPVPQIRFRAQVPVTAANGSVLRNTTVVVSPQDSSEQIKRTATRDVSASVPSGLLISKSVTPTLIEVGGPFTNTVTYNNTSAVPLDRPDFIDILPVVGDGSGTWGAAAEGRVPPSAFAGTRTLQSVTATTPAGFTLYVTNTAIGSLNKAPSVTANLNPGVGASIWCQATITAGVVTVAGGQPAGCAGTTAATLTAIRVIDLDTSYPTADGARSFSLNFSTAGNANGNLYTNDAGGFARGGLVLPVVSNDVTVTVVSSSLSGRVYRDDNNNGLQDAGEPGILGVTVTLCKVNTAPCPTASVQGTAQVTDINGDYKFVGVPAGTYSVFETQPATYTSGVVNVPGTSGGTNSGTDAFQTVVLAVGTDAINYNFGEVGIPKVGTRKALNTAVAPVAGQPGVFDVPLRIAAKNYGTTSLGVFNITDTVCGTGGTFAAASACAIQVAPVVTVTGAGTVATTNGVAYTGLAAGKNLLAAGAVLEVGGEISVDVTVRVTLGASATAFGFNNQATATGTPSTGGPISDLSNNGASYTGGADTDPTGASSNAPTPINFAVLQGKVFVDANNNGAVDTGDTGINTVTLTVSGGALSTALTVTTDTNGNYFAVVPVSATPYVIAQTQPAAYQDGKDIVGTGAILAAAPAGSPLSSPAGAGAGVADAGTGQGTGADRYSGIVASTPGLYGNFNFGEVQSVAVSGTVFNDTNGLLGTPANTVDGTGTNAGSTALTAYLVLANQVVASSPVSALNGTYSFPSVLAGTGYTVVLANTAVVVAVGAAPPPASLPTGWVNTGENNAVTAGSDGTVDGISAAFNVATTAVTNVNFGIEQPPTAGASVAAAVSNPGGTNTLPVPAGLFVGPLPSGATGTLSADNTSVTGVRITALPTNTTSITLNGISYGTCGTCTAFPTGTGVSLTVAQLAAMVLDPVDGTASAVIPYVAVDAAGKESAAGSVTLPLSLLNVSGTVFNDTNGLLGTPANTVDGVGTNTGGTTLNAYLVKAGNVVASSPVSATGLYNFTNVPAGTGYTVVLSNVAPVVANTQPAPGAALPTGWANTGEFIGTGVGSDGIVNGVSAVFALTTTDQPNVNFGIEQIPTAGASTAGTQPNPGGTNTVPVPAGLFVGPLPSGAVGTTALDTTAVTGIRITAMPTSTDSITLNGVTYGSCGTCTVFPTATGVSLTLAQLATITLDPVDGNVTPVINYVALDAAGKESTPGTGTVNLPLGALSVTGNVFNDTNGLLGTPANTVDGTGTNAASVGLTAYLVQAGNVVASSPVTSGGAFSINNVPVGTGYTVVIANTATLVAAGQPAPAASLPTGWSNTGENNGAGAGSDGTVNGTSAAFAVSTANVANVNFGIEQPPVAGVALAAAQPNPGGTATVPVPAGLFLGPLPTGATGGTASDNTAVTAIRITTMPTNTTSFTVGGTTYGTCATCTAFPVTGVTATVAQLALLTLDPVDGTVTPVITYLALDEAGLPSATPGTVSLPLNGLNVSGNVFNDTNGLLGTPLNTVDGVGTNAASTGLTAYLVQAGKVVASSPVSALGAYTMNNIAPGAGYTVVLANTPVVVAVGQNAPAPSLPAGWVNTGEFIGAVAGSDGTVDGTSAPFALVATTVTNVNFGIEQPPVAGNTVTAATTNPGGTATVTVPTGVFTGPLPTGATGTVSSDVTGISAVRITALPTNLTTLSVTVSGVTTTYGPGATPFPAAGVTVPVADLVNLKFDPKDGVVDTVISYYPVDAAGKESAVVGTVKVPLNTVDLKLEKTSAGSFVKSVQGGYTLKVTNVGTAASAGTLTVTDTLPAGVTFVASGTTLTGAATATDVSCTAATATATGQVVTCTSTATYTLAPAGTFSINFKVNVGQTAGVPCVAPLTGQCVTNNAVVSAPGDGVPANDTASVTTQIVTGPDLVLVKAALTNPMTVNNNATYTLQVSNIGPVDAPFTAPGGVPADITVTDTLPANMQFVSAIGTDWKCAAVAQVVTCTTAKVVTANGGQASLINLVVKPLAALVNQTVTNKAEVQGGGEPAVNYDSADAAKNGTINANNNSSVAVKVQDAASVAGVVWRDVNHDRQLGAAGAEERVPGFVVEAVDPATGAIVATTKTDASGAYRLENLVPGNKLRLQFRDPATGGLVMGVPSNNDQQANTAAGSTYTSPAGAVSQIPTSRDGLVITLVPGNTLTNQSLPLDPAGVIYDSFTRLPIRGAVVTLLRNGTPVPVTDLVGYPVGATTNAQTTCGPTVTVACPLPGAYQFLLQSGAPTGDYTIAVTAPGYVTSTSITPEGDVFAPTGVAGSVVSINRDNLNGNPPPQVGQNTTYYYRFTLAPGSGAGVVNNHIPLDPAIKPKLAISKTGDRKQVEMGDSLRYTLTVRRTDTGVGNLTSFAILDTLPAGFRYIPGTLSVNGTPVADAQAGVINPGVTLPMLINFGAAPLSATAKPGLAAGGTTLITYRVRIGAGAMQGTGVNRAQAKLAANVNCQATPDACSNEAQYKVEVTGGVFTNQACMTGKVYVDCNNNQVQDGEEMGIPGVRLYLNDGTSIISDVEGKYSLCDMRPQTWVLKADKLTLPKGSRLVTSSSRNAGDAGSLFLDLKNGELMRADFIEGSCSNTVLEQVKARRTQGEISPLGQGSSQTEKKGGNVLKFKGKAANYPQEGTDSADQPLVKPRTDGGQPDTGQSVSELNNPVRSIDQPKASQGAGK